MVRSCDECFEETENDSEVFCDACLSEHQEADEALIAAARAEGYAQALKDIQALKEGGALPLGFAEAKGAVQKVELSQADTVIVDGITNYDCRVTYIGQATRQPDGTWRSLAIVDGALCIVELSIHFDGNVMVPSQESVPGTINVVLDNE
jgi:hypothetical protein